MYVVDEMISRLKAAKEKRGLTNKSLAQLSGVPLGTLNKIFGSETKDPQISNIIKISNALDVSANYIILGVPASDKDNIGPETASEETRAALSPLDLQLVDILGSLSTGQKELLLAQIQTLLSAQNSNQEK